MKNQYYNTINKIEVEIYNKVNTKLPPKRRGMISEVKQMQKAKAKSKGKKSLF